MVWLPTIFAGFHRAVPAAGTTARAAGHRAAVGHRGRGSRRSSGQERRRSRRRGGRVSGPLGVSGRWRPDPDGGRGRRRGGRRSEEVEQRGKRRQRLSTRRPLSDGIQDVRGPQS